MNKAYNKCFSDLAVFSSGVTKFYRQGRRENSHFVSLCFTFLLISRINTILSVANSGDAYQPPCFKASDLILRCSPMSYLFDTTHSWQNEKTRDLS